MYPIFILRHAEPHETKHVTELGKAQIETLSNKIILDLTLKPQIITSTTERTILTGNILKTYLDDKLRNINQSKNELINFQTDERLHIRHSCYKYKKHYKQLLSEFYQISKTKPLIIISHTENISRFAQQLDGKNYLRLRDFESEFCSGLKLDSTNSKFTRYSIFPENDNI